MNLRYITCSDPRENLEPIKVVGLLKSFPLAELGIQVFPSTMGKGKEMYTWFNKVIEYAKESKEPLNFALHVNHKWCDEICTGNIPGEIKHFLKQKHSYTGQPLVSRVQLNIGDYTHEFNARKLADLISKWKKYEVILAYNSITRPQVEELKITGAQFTLLFDESYGAGIVPKKRLAPVYKDVQFGYAGGIAPATVSDTLDQIANVVPANYDTWIDAEGRLRDATRTMNLDLARDYLKNAMDWYTQHTK